ncbi:MAG: glucuronate isomerase, partial [Candidatus Amulumruptor sp.]|nr:glucuronate isomerase [Candidatus Amulumruptor sp.]
RRVLCSVIGADVERGLIPDSEMPRVESMIEDICHNNAKAYFRI